jgi:hypothetical protein
VECDGCGRPAAVVRSRLQGGDLTIASCAHCGTRRWIRDGRVLPLPDVLALVHEQRRSVLRTQADRRSEVDASGERVLAEARRHHQQHPSHPLG